MANEIAQFQEDRWLSIIHTCRNSGKTVKTWCAENGITPRSYYYHLKKARKMMIESSTSNPAKQGTFAEVPAVGSVSSGTALRIRRGETVIEVSADAPESILSLVAEVFRRAE